MQYWMKVRLWIDVFGMLTKRISMDVKHNQMHVFKSDRGALSAKDERETLLTTRSSSEKLFFSVVLMTGDS